MATNHWSGEGPILIVSAGRSGSKMLRGILSQAPGSVSFPREINYIWRHGNASFPSDELSAAHARPEVVRFIRQRFDALRQRAGARTVIEKTCANSLRVPFIHAVFPEAHVVHLVRDGRAVAESARRRWLATPDLRYIWEKSRWVPLVDLPYYGWRFLRFQVGRLQGSSGSPSSWGPRFSGQNIVMRENSLLEVCGIQWRECVKAAAQDLETLPAEQVTTILYEELVRDPVGVSQRLFAKLHLEFGRRIEDYLQDNVTDGHADKWRERLTDEELALLSGHIEDALLCYGYI